MNILTSPDGTYIAYDQMGEGPEIVLLNLNPRSELADAARVFHDLVTAGKRDEAVAHFMGTVVGLPPEFLAGARQSPFWEGQVTIAHTLEYDATVMGDYSMPVELARSIAVPTIIGDGSASTPFMRETADRLAQLIPNATRVTLDGQQHNVDGAVLGAALKEFLAA